MPEDLLSQLEEAAGRAAERVGAATVAIGRAPRGSGVVVAPDRVLTNAHNLRDRTTQVTFEDRAEQGTVLAVDPGSDLAVLEVTTEGVEPLTWAEAAPGVGAAVFAVARGARGTRLSVGFVSATQRAFRGPGGRPIGGGLEHTAPMARGSSGGPLVDTSGSLVGINTHRLGEGFYVAQAVEPGLVERVAGLADGVSPQRAELGIAVAPAEVARRLRRSVGLDERDGVLVRSVREGSPAEGAGLREGDLIVAAGDQSITSIDQLHLALGAHDPASPLTLGILRGAEQLDVRVEFS